MLPDTTSRLNIEEKNTQCFFWISQQENDNSGGADRSHSFGAGYPAQRWVQQPRRKKRRKRQPRFSRPGPPVEKLVQILP